MYVCMRMCVCVAMHSASSLSHSASVCWNKMMYPLFFSRWSPDAIWCDGMNVQWNGEFFKAEGPQNVAIPCDSSQECFYVCVPMLTICP